MMGEKGQDLTPEAAEEYDVGIGPEPSLPSAVAVCDEARDAVEQLWGSIFFSPERTAPKTIVVTAAESEEGVTHIASALALTSSSAEHGMNVVLVDFNIRRPKIAQIFGVEPSPGVIDVIAGDAQTSAAVVHTQIPGLDVLPSSSAGQDSISSHPGQNIANMIRELSEKYDQVIIDAPPVNRYATVQAIAGMTDGVILVVKAGVTRRESIAESKKRVELAQGKIIGVVLNQRVFPIPDFLYSRI